MKTILKIIGIIIGICLLLVATIVIAINTDFVQNKILKYATAKLSEKLQTKVEAESISINFFSLSADLHGVSLELPGKKADNLIDMETMRLKGKRVDIQGLHFRTDNHLSRKNEGKPKRGWFDAGHIDIMADLQLQINHLQKDTISASIIKGTATDSISGFNIKDLRMDVTTDLKQMDVRNAVIQQGSTIIQIPEARLWLPNKKDSTAMSYYTPEPLKAHVILQDISRLFTPALAQFTLPLELSVMVEGDADTMQFRDIKVNTEDEKFALKATGGIENLRNKYLLAISFHVDEMLAKNEKAEDIINQFVVKKFMMKQLKSLGDIRYTGDFSVLRKREVFAGKISTEAGSLNLTNLILNDSTKFVSGTVSTTDLELGKAIGMEDIGKVEAKATFDFDISKERTALIRKQKGGKLLIGAVDAFVTEANYKKVKVKNISVEIDSDGAEATGNLSISGRIADSRFAFTFTDTNEMQKMKVKPGLKIHFPRLNIFSKKKANSQDKTK